GYDCRGTTSLGKPFCDRRIFKRNSLCIVVFFPSLMEDQESRTVRAFGPCFKLTDFLVCFGCVRFGIGEPAAKRIDNDESRLDFLNHLTDGIPLVVKPVP